MSSVEWRLQQSPGQGRVVGNSEEDGFSTYLVPATEQSLASPPPQPRAVFEVYSSPPSYIIACRKYVVLLILDEWIKSELLVKVLEKDLRTVRKMWGRRERKQEGVGAEKGPFRFDCKEGLRRQNKDRDWEEGKQKKQG